MILILQDMRRSPGKKISVFLFTLFLCGPSFAGKLDKAFNALHIYNYFEAKRLFTKSLRAHPSAAAYGLASIFSRNNNPFFDLDSAHRYIAIAENSFKTISPKEKKYIAKFKVDNSKTLELKEYIYTKAFESAAKENKIEALDHFISAYADDVSKKNEAIDLRNALAFTFAKRSDTYQAYADFLKKYPAAKETEEAKYLYESSLYYAFTHNGTLSDYEHFIEKFPNSPYKDEAENNIYALAAPNGSIAELHAFVKKFPSNHNVENAWHSIYTLFTSDFSSESIERFLKKFPDYPFADVASRDLELARLVLLPVKIKNKWGFCDTAGVIKIDCVYDWCENFSEGLAEAGKDNKAGFIS